MLKKYKLWLIWVGTNLFMLAVYGIPKDLIERPIKDINLPYGQVAHNRIWTSFLFFSFGMLLYLFIKPIWNKLSYLWLFWIGITGSIICIYGIPKQFMGETGYAPAWWSWNSFKEFTPTYFMWEIWFVYGCALLLILLLRTYFQIIDAKK